MELKNEKFFQAPTCPRYIVQNPKNGTFEECFDSNDYILAKRFYRKIKAETSWFENIITHNPTIGTFYEDLLRNTLSEFAPTNNKIGTGFVYDSEMRAHSKQIDIMIYDDSDRCVLYRNGNFVIVYPGSVLSAIEVKKTLGTTALKEIVGSTFFNSLGSYSKKETGIQRINIFAFSLSCKIDTLCRSLVAALEDCINKLKVENGDATIPISRCALPFIYFLDDNYYIGTSISKIEGIKFELKVGLHKTEQAGSLGTFLSNTFKENYDKITSFESNLLSRKIRHKPQEYTVRGDLLLIKKISYKNVIKHFRAEKNELEKIEHKGFKPLSIFIPATDELDGYMSFRELFSIPGVWIECYNKETNNFVRIDGSEIMTTIDA